MSSSLRVPLAIVVVALLVLGLLLGGGYVVSRAMSREARELASRLTGCPAREIDVESIATGDTEHWRVEGCGIRGVLMCEPTDAGCIIVPDEPFQ